MPHRPTFLAFLATCAVLAAGCGAHVQHRAEANHLAGFPVTVRNCGKSRTFDHPPRRAVAYDTGIVEMMFALGLQDHMAGYVISDGQNRAIASSPWKAGYHQVPRIGHHSISKENILGAHADFVFAGWHYGFSESSGLTPASLRKLGIDSYVLSESCRNGLSEDSRGTMPPLRALYTDVRNLGRIFGVPDRAARLVDRFRATVAKARSSVRATANRPTVFLYDSGTDEPLTGGRFAASHAIITKAGGNDIMSDLRDTWTSVSWETVIERDPDVIVVNDYASPNAEQKESFLESYPPLATVDAVKHHRFLVLPYAALVESPRNPAAIATVARYLNSLHG